MKKITSILVLVLMLGIIGLAGCTSSSDNKTVPSYSNNTTSTAQTPSPVNDTSSSSNSNISDSTSSSKSSSVTAGSFVANANTGKFHYASCRYVNKMDEGNKIFYNSREDALAAGYVPCKVCDP